MSELLKPCPFCGGAVDLEQTTSYYNEIYGNRKWWGVVCRNTKNVGGTCAVSIAPSASEEAAMKRWNTRAPTPPAPQPMTDAAIRELAHQHLLGRGDGDILNFARALLAAQEGNPSKIKFEDERTAVFTFQIKAESGYESSGS